MSNHDGSTTLLHCSVQTSLAFRSIECNRSSWLIVKINTRTRLVWKPVGPSPVTRGSSRKIRLYSVERSLGERPFVIFLRRQNPFCPHHITSAIVIEKFSISSSPLPIRSILSVRLRSRRKPRNVHGRVERSVRDRDQKRVGDVRPIIFTRHVNPVREVSNAVLPFVVPSLRHVNCLGR